MSRKNTYPHRLLPQARFKVISSFKGLGNHYILRLAPKGVVIKNVTQLKSNFKCSIQSKEFVDGVSVNLISVFRKKDVLLRPNFALHPDWEKDWKPNTTTDRPMQDVIHYKKHSYFGFRIRDLSTITFRYHPIKNIDEPTMAPIDLFLRVEHRPSKINFWHCNIFISEQGTNIDIRKEFDEKVIKRMAKIVIPYLLKYALLPTAMKGKKVEKGLYMLY